MDFQLLAAWRKARISVSRLSKKANVIEILKEDALRLADGSMKICYNLPCEVTTTGGYIRCCSVAFETLYGMSPKTRVKYASYVKVSNAIMDDEFSEMKTARGEARRHWTLLWMKREFEVLCDFLPTSDYTSKDHHLPKCVSKNSLYEEYRVQYLDEEKERGPEFKPYSRSTFTKLWKLEFPYVTIPTHTAFSVCMTCAMLHDELLTATKSKDKSKLVILKALRRTHLGFISKERLSYRQHQELSRDEPDKYLSLCIDGMDQAKLCSPHFAGGALPKGWYHTFSSFPRYSRSSKKYVFTISLSLNFLCYMVFFTNFSAKRK